MFFLSLVSASHNVTEMQQELSLSFHHDAILQDLLIFWKTTFLRKTEQTAQFLLEFY